MIYNTLCESFPNNFFANWFSFTAAELLEIEDEAKRAVPEVSF
jgi:LemA protein